MQPRYIDEPRERPRSASGNRSNIYRSQHEAVKKPREQKITDDHIALGIL